MPTKTRSTKIIEHALTLLLGALLAAAGSSSHAMREAGPIALALFLVRSRVQRRRVALLLDGVDGLARHIHRFCQLLLGERLSGAESSDVVAHGVERTLDRVER